MKCRRRLFFLLAVSLTAAFAASQDLRREAALSQGQVLEGLHFSSPLLNRDVNYAIYLPPDYQMSTRRYPVVYLLHGYTDNESAWIQFGEIFGPKLSGKDRLTARFRNYHPLDLAKTLPETSLKKVRFYLDYGDDDFLYKGNAALHVALRDRKIPHEFRVRDGGHT